MVRIGKYNELRVTRETASGYYLDGGQLGEILLPGNQAPKDLIWGSDLKVFIYLDSEDRLVATTETPKATVGQFACLEVLTVHPQIGAFLDWGLGKDLLLPFREQAEPVDAGEQVVVYVKLDERSNRIVATTRFNRYLNKGRPAYRQGEAVGFMITHRTPLGYSAIVEGEYAGMVYHSSIGTNLEPGQTVKGFVRTVRPDGKIDLSLDPPGAERFKNLPEQIMDALKANGGYIPFDDNSSPESIRETFNTSKKTFKKVLSTLYKERRIRFRESGGIEQA